MRENLKKTKKVKGIENLKTNFYCSYGSEAYDYNYEQNYIDNIEKRSFNRSIIKEIKSKSKAVPALFSLLGLVFAGCLITLYSFCQIKAKTHSIYKLQQKLDNLKSSNLELEEELSKKFDLGEIKNIAEKKLGMHKPMQYQIVYIKKPTQSYTIKYK